MRNLAQTDSDRAAEWIPPWTCGLRLITLWDMKEYLAPRLTKLAREFTDASGVFICREDNLDDEDKKELLEGRRMLRPWCKKMRIMHLTNVADAVDWWHETKEHVANPRRSNSG